jgi:hypothetical protein
VGHVGGLLDSSLKYLCIFGVDRLTFSGHPRMENGHNPEENQVSSTSSSCSRTNFFPFASVVARDVASSSVRPTTQCVPSFGCLT